MEKAENSPKTERKSLTPLNNVDSVVSGTIEPFEGPEKLLEIWFLFPSVLSGEQKAEKLDSKKDGLRSISRENWEAMLKLVKCTVLSVKENEYFDAYLLSESSLLVWSQKVILKTCGTTTLLLALPSLLQMAADVGLTVVGNVFYSRRSFFFQAKQPAPHSSFRDEVKFLDDIFDGSAYVLGKKNGDHWYLYLTDNDELTDNSVPKTTEKLPRIPLSKSKFENRPDFTLEILMTHLDVQVMKQFWKKDLSAKEVTKRSGIASFFPSAIIDDYLFDPCGYSMNGLLDDGYYTIHITPQPSCSYVSFETNIECDYAELMKKVLTAFKPGNFCVSLFAGHKTKQDFATLTHSTMPLSLLGVHTRQALTNYEFENDYQLAFASYERKQTEKKSKKRKAKRQTLDG